MKQVRLGVFETNSSSVHSMTIMDRSIFEEWKTNGLYLNYGRNEPPEFLTREAVIERIGETYAKEKEWYDDEIYLFARYGWSRWEDYGDGYEVDWGFYTTPSGDEIAAVAYYGHD